MPGFDAETCIRSGSHGCGAGVFITKFRRPAPGDRRPAPVRLSAPRRTSPPARWARRSPLRRRNCLSAVPFTSSGCDKCCAEPARPVFHHAGHRGWLCPSCRETGEMPLPSNPSQPGEAPLPLSGDWPIRNGRMSTRRPAIRSRPRVEPEHHDNDRVHPRRQCHLRKILRHHPRGGGSVALLDGGGGPCHPHDPCLRPGGGGAALRLLARLRFGRRGLPPGPARRYCAMRKWSRTGSPAPGCRPTTRWSARCAIRARRHWRKRWATRGRPPHWNSGATGWKARSSPSANAPTALFHLLDMLAAGAPRPAAIIGMPVGFVGAVESKEALAAGSHGIPFAIVRGAHGRQRHDGRRPSIPSRRAGL